MGNSCSFNNLWPQNQTFDWGNNYWSNFNWNQNFTSSFQTTPIWGNTTASAPAADGLESAEAYEKRIEAELEEERKKFKAQLELITVKNEQTEQLEKELKTTNEQLHAVTKKADGSATAAPKYKESGKGGKALRWLSNAGTSLANMGKNFVGYEQDGSWNWKKCLKNVGIAAAAVGACFIPGVGPVIAAGLATAGVAGGAYGVAKGAEKLNKAKTDEEIDKAQQDICSNAFIGITSALGLRGMGSGLRTASTTAARSGSTAAGASSTAASTTATSAASSTAASAGAGSAATTTTAAAASAGNTTITASSAAQRSGLLGKLVENTSNFGRDITVNAYRATKQAIKNDKDIIATNGGGVKGVVKGTKAKATQAYNNFNSWQNRYNNQSKQIETSINNKLGELNGDIKRLENIERLNGSLTSAERQKLALLREEKYLVEQNLKEFNAYFTTTRQKALYDKLSSTNSATKAVQRVKNRNASANPQKVRGQDIPKEELNAFYKRVLAEQKTYGKSLKELIKMKENLMRSYAKHETEHAAELAQYIPSPDVKAKWYKISTWGKNDYQLAIGGQNPGKYVELSGVLFNSPATTVPKALTRIDPIYSGPMLLSQDFTKEQAEEYFKPLEDKKEVLENTIAEIEKIKTTEEWNAFIAKLQSAQAQAQANEAAQAQAQSQQAKQEVQNEAAQNASGNAQQTAEDKTQNEKKEEAES